MKLFHYYMISVLLMGGLLLQSCYKDKGNYDIRPVDVVAIGGPAHTPDNYSVTQFDTLKIRPVFTFSGDSNTLEYTWKLFPTGARTGDTTIRVISTDKQLKYVIKIPIGAYTVSLDIKDPKTEIIRSRMFGVSVRTKAAQGFLVLNNKNNDEQDIDVIQDNTKPEIFFGVFSANNTIRLKEATDLSMLQSFANPNGLLYVFRKTGGYTLLPSFGFLQEAKAWFFDPQGTLAPTAIYQDAFGMNAYLVNNGNVHYTITNNPPALFGYRAAGDYKATKVLFMSAYAFAYDDLNHRFLKLNKTTGRMTSIIKNPVEDKFDVENIGNKSCLLFDHNMASNVSPSTTNNNILKPIAYCKDNATGEVFVYKFGFFRSLATYCESVKQVTAPGFATATAYANASNNPLTYYASGNKIYAYDFTNDAARVVYTFDDTSVSIDKLMTNGPQLLAVANGKTGNTGAVYFFRVDATGNFTGGTHFSKYEGFGKILDIEYKYNTINTGALWK